MVFYEVEVFDGYLELDFFDFGQFFSIEVESFVMSLLFVFLLVLVMFGVFDLNFMCSLIQVIGNFVFDLELQGFDQFEIESFDWVQYFYDYMEMEFEVNLFDVDLVWIENMYQISDNFLFCNIYQV